MSLSDKVEDDVVELDTRKSDVDSYLSSPGDPLEYVSKYPSTYGVSSEEEVYKDSGNENQLQGCYSLRTRAPVNYAEWVSKSIFTSLAQADNPKKVDEPKLSDVLKSSDKDKCEQGICEEFEVIENNETLVVLNGFSLAGRVLSSGNILKLKCGPNRKIVR